MDLFVVPTIGFELLYAFVIVRLDRDSGDGFARDCVVIQLLSRLYYICICLSRKPIFPRICGGY
jgi:hypothetical protein